LRSGQDVLPPLPEADRETLVALAALHAFVGRRHLLAEDVGIEAPLARVVERRIAVLEAGKRSPLRLVHLRPAREHHHLRGAGLERARGIVEGGRAGAEDAYAFSLELREVDVIRRVMD